ncbi:hypothetical protein D9756_004027 [Leucocoprinus leucothites]|uniref:F-box domain-containing protein n=1 Tax=Leucocoprinus leucothites TaxID=201217 RepID=A0A8H5G0L3_9AGAR|nr:hypothetical protein D9756_004027 [Leucoagaricus leucothites]
MRTTSSGIILTDNNPLFPHLPRSGPTLDSEHSALCMHPPQPSVIFTIPLELVHRILTLGHPDDVAAFSRTCRSAHELVQDEYLWRQIWHAYPFDDPELLRAHRQAVCLATSLEISPLRDGWKAEFTRRIRAEHVALKKREHYSSLSPKEKKTALQVFVSVLEGALPASVGGGMEGKFRDASISQNIQWVQRVLFHSRLIAPVLQSLEDEKEISELQAHIRSCMDEYEWGGKTRRAISDRRNRSRAFVYDLRNYSYKNDYGPYHPDGRVSWVHIENIVNVVLSNLQDLPVHIVSPARPPSGLESLRPYSAPGKYSPRDWAGVEGLLSLFLMDVVSSQQLGTWRRYVCFMDYRDLFAFNYSDIADGPLHPKFFEDPRFREATRLIEVKLHIIPRSEIRFFPPSEIQLSASQKHPLTFFHGTSKGVNGNESTVEGYVRMARDGTVRWRLVSLEFTFLSSTADKQKLSIYDNSPQWSSNGVQIGDVGSARGGVGVWTTKTHEQGDPVGPFWFWKVEDDCSENLVEYT